MPNKALQRTSTIKTDGMVKVGLRAPDGDFETMWATPLGNDRYRLENSPFYAYRVSWQDVVEARPEDETGLPVVQRAVEKSGHRTVRLILVASANEVPEQDRVLDDLNALGCTYEGYNPRYFAIDIPPGIEFSAVVDYLTRGEHRWEYVDPSYDEVNPVCDPPTPPLSVHRPTNRWG
jgi:hypothetical protein